MKTLFILIIACPFFTFSQQNYSYKNLVFEGGGIRGLAYPGALKVLEEKGVIKNIERVAGTSAGAVTALMVGLGYNSHEIDSIVYALKVQQFNDGNIFGSLRRIKKEYGIFKGDKYEKWLGQLINNKTGSANTTFFQLHQLHLSNNNFKDVYCTGTNLTLQKLVIFSWENTPHMQIKTAVHISGCIPVYFKPVAVDSLWNHVSVKKSKTKYDLYVDGGLINNYPINIFDTCVNGNDPFVCDSIVYNFKTLGLKLERHDQIQQFEQGFTDVASYPVSSFTEHLMGLNNLLQETLGRKTHNLKNEMGRTIYISYGNIFGKPRKVSQAEKKVLIDNGVKAAEKFFINLNKTSLQ